MSEKDLEVLITLDDPGEDTLEEDTFHQTDNTGAHRLAGDAVIARRRWFKSCPISITVRGSFDVNKRFRISKTAWLHGSATK